MKLLAAVLASSLVLAVPAAAQQRTAAFATAPRAMLSGPDAAGPAAAVAGSIPRPSEHALRRSGYGLLGWAGGLVAGGAIGLALNEAAGSDPETGNLQGAIFGGAVGSTLGSAMGAATPRYAARCGYGSRAGKAVLGSLMGTVAGFAVATWTDSTPVGIVTVPLGSATGAGLAARC